MQHKRKKENFLNKDHTTLLFITHTVQGLISGIHMEKKHKVEVNLV